MYRQAATDCGGWRAGHNGDDAASCVSVSEASTSIIVPVFDDGQINGKTGYPKMNSIQIAAPQRTTNPANESKTSTSSRVMFRFCQMMLVGREVRIPPRR